MMSAVGEWFDEHAAKLEAWAKALIGHEDPAVKAVGHDLAKSAGEIRAEAGTVEHNAESAGETVVHEAQSEAAPVLAEAEHDAAKTAEATVAEVAADVVKDA